MDRINKIFCIGLSKTGTTSLTEALRFLGYRSRHFPIGMVSLRDGQLHFDYEQAKEFDALSDTPIARFYKELDGEFPCSKFILTVRDQKSWIESCRRHFWKGKYTGNEIISKLSKDLYGTVEFDEACFQKSYDNHLRDVHSYFANRKTDVLTMDICAGEGWEKLCPFLGVSVPWPQFFHCNVQGKTIKYRVWRAVGGLKRWSESSARLSWKSVGDFCRKED